MKAKYAILLSFIFIFAFSCSMDVDDDAGNNRQLSSIEYVQQPQNSVYCGAANIMMVENYFFNQSNSMAYIFSEVSGVSTMGNLVNMTYKMGNYLESKGLYTSIVRFSDSGLKTILNYCESNQVPAIMNVQSEGNPQLGHYILFTGYNQSDNTISVLDPGNRNRRSITYENLVNIFSRVSPTAENGGNIVILANDRVIGEWKEITCGSCLKTIGYDSAIEEAILHLGCTGCDVAWFIDGSKNYVYNQFQVEFPNYLPELFSESEIQPGFQERIAN